MLLDNWNSCEFRYRLLVIFDLDQLVIVKDESTRSPTCFEDKENHFVCNT